MATYSSKTPFHLEWFLVLQIIQIMKINELCQVKRAFKQAQNADSGHPAQIFGGPLLSFIHSLVSVDSEGPDQTAWLHRLISAFTVFICPKTYLLNGMAQIHLNKSKASNLCPNFGNVVFILLTLI